MLARKNFTIKLYRHLLNSEDRTLIAEVAGTPPPLRSAAIIEICLQIIKKDDFLSIGPRITRLKKNETILMNDSAKFLMKSTALEL
jgi:hypothetical protein